MQAWERAPLGPLLAKNFAASVSPWIVTLDALAPCRCAWGREASDAVPLAYLGSAERHALLEHGDELMLRAGCEAPAAVRIGLGACSRRVLPAHPVR